LKHGLAVGSIYHLDLVRNKVLETSNVSRWS